MVDIHCHILPGLDDGPREMEESLAMAESAIADGVTSVVATPHSSSQHSFDYPRVRELRAQMQSTLGTRLKLATGCDFHLNRENFDALRAEAPRFCINQQNYLLVEFNEFSIPTVMDQTLHEIQLLGLYPIITHPERNAIIRSHPERLATWVRHGCYAQVTAGALTGGFGPSSQKIAVQWIGEGLVHFVASDAHGTRTRPLRLKPAFELIAKQFGTAKAYALFIANPQAAFNGDELPHVPDIEAEPPANRKRFLFF